jgi:two-component system, NtrC family, response regulator AlgB
MDIQRTVGISELRFSSSAPTAKELVAKAPLLESQNLKMKSLLETAKRAAAANTTILLTGESGTGKDVLARQIHRWSPRREGPFVVINCTTLADQLMENELFGHVRGAFTGAVSDRPGRLEAAESGTVFLDEIAELPFSLQTKFLRFIHEQSFERVGSNRTIRLNTRIIAASNRDLDVETAAGRFRQDLYYRLNVITLRLLPLRDRIEDIVPLAQSFLKQMSPKAGSTELTLSEEAAERLANYRWPGNLRELRNALERAATLAHSEIITVDDLPDNIRHPVSGMSVRTQGASLDEFEREHILRILAESSTLEQAAATLGINVTTLWRKRRHHGIIRE